MMEALAAAEAEWLALSTRSSRPLLGYRNRPLNDEFREIGGIAAWVKWEQGVCKILRVERTDMADACGGGAKALLRKLMAISDRHGVPLHGNVVCLPTAECPMPDLGRLIALYRGLGFEVSDTRERELHYQPHRGDA
jgi:hypothetical protein